MEKAKKVLEKAQEEFGSEEIAGAILLIASETDGVCMYHEGLKNNLVIDALIYKLVEMLASEDSFKLLPVTLANLKDLKTAVDTIDLTKATLN